MDDQSEDREEEPSARLQPAEDHSVEVELQIGTRINFALQQNGVKVVHLVRIVNRSESNLTDLVVRLHGEPEFCAGWSGRIDHLAPGREVAFEAIDLNLSPAFLVNLTEAIRAKIWLEVSAANRLLRREGRDVDLLAYDQWPGISVIPEIIAAFVLPNHPDVARILTVAADLLEQATGDPALCGYQSEDPNRVWAIASAIYRAVQVLGIEYVNPPASFEAEGQKVRTPDRILADKRGTCLDLSLLLAACLEQSGLHPWMIFVEGHAFPGVWLRDELAPSAVIDDASALRKRRDLGEIHFFDSSSVANRPMVDFDAAVRSASAYLEHDANFSFAVDVHQARRAGGIRPIAGRVAEGHFQPLVEPAPDPAARVGTWKPGELPPDLSRASARGAPAERILDGPTARLGKWKRKLLDLSLRNRLLNFRDSKRTIPLLIPNIATFEDAIASGRGFDIDPIETNEGGSAASRAGSLRVDDPARREFLEEQIARWRLKAALSVSELEARLLHIYRDTKSAIEETGANTLYVALGMLRWFPTATSSEPRIAPILLVPLEIKRQSARDRFRISLGTDEPRVNQTLFEMLRQDFRIDLSALEEIPADESGVDVPLVLRTVRSAIRDIPRWDVVEEAWIGLFSFSKFLMWRDLTERAASLLANPVISHLVTRSAGAFDGGGPFVEGDQVDQRSPAATFCPLDADASQLAAVFSAQEGRSFALWGPPGTGKSQTIANLIAQCLATGKTVLFVAEKVAALNVVRARLDKVGLGPFCLELHSNKASKLHVLKQLQAALDAGRGVDPAEWSTQAGRLQAVRVELNQYAGALGRQRPPGWSVFRVTSELIGLRDVKQVVLSWPSINDLSHELLEDLRTQVRRLATNGLAIGGPADHPWRGIDRTEWSNSWQSAVVEAAESLGSTLSALRDATLAVEQRLNLGARSWSLPRTQTLSRLCDLLLATPGPSGSLLKETDWGEATAVLSRSVELGRRRDLLRAELAERFNDEIFALNLAELRAGLARAEESNALLRWFRRRPALRALRATAKDKNSVLPGEALATVQSAIEVDDLHSKLDEVGAAAGRLLGRDWRDGLADWDRVEHLIEWSDELRGLTTQFADDAHATRSQLLASWSALVGRDGHLLESEGLAARELARCRSAIHDLQQSWQRFREVAGVIADTFVDGGEEASLDRLASRIDACRRSAARIREWCAWQDARQKAVGSRLGALVDAYERHELQSRDLETVFEKSIRLWWLDFATESETALRAFFSPDHERKIREFRTLDEKMLALAGPLVYSRLAASLPRLGADPAAGSEMGILARELRKKARHMPVRRLIENIPHLLPRLKPCFLMSPLSVAQFLDTDIATFDLVVFDEASQIPVWDAIGALARGRQSIVVGDPKQLPPTNFFMRSDDEEDVDEVDTQDQESILDEFIGAQMPELKLGWHYRSRHESLIAFSNRHYYENRLLTFPSPLADGIGVVHRAVPDGHYDKGKSRTNRAEAEALVTEVVRRLRDPEVARYSIGVVTFSQAQQTLVEDLIDAARQANPEIEAFFGDAVSEPVFVKNLENVQGDERDVILFSIGYGPDLLGRVSMNFGPLNRSGGERRLNVAVTRARVELVVFSTLRSEQIDLNRTRATGVEHLKFFLEYAERGPRALLAGAAASSQADFDSPFESEVCRALERNGHRIAIQIGCAGYRVDLAIVDPEAPGRYLLGIECDGATYHGSRIARERDRLRESVLRGLGWNLHRVWSTDWWQNPGHEVEKIERALQEARLRPPQRPSPSLPAVIRTPGDATDAAPGESAAVAADDTIATAPPAPLATVAPEFALVASAARPAAAAAAASCDAKIPLYRAAQLPSLQLDSEALYTPPAGQKVRGLFQSLVNEEAPVTVDYALRRIGEAWGLGRVGNRARERLLDVLRSMNLHIRTTAGVASIWPSARQADAWQGYRTNGTGDQRAVTEIPAEELVGAVADALETNVSLRREDLIRESARLLGFARLGRVVQTRLAAAVDLAVKTNRAEEIDGWVRHSVDR